MIARFEVELTKAEYVVGLQALTGELARRDRDGNRRIYERLALMVGLILAVGFLFPDAMTGIFFAIIAWALAEWVMARRWIGKAHGVSFDPSVGPATIEFADDGVTETAVLRTREWQWPAVRKVHVRDSALVFELIGWDMIVLPSRLWADADSRDAFLGEVRSRLPHSSADSVSSAPSPMPLTADFFRLAAIGAFVDAFLVMALLLPAYTRRYGPLADDLGFAGGMLLYTMLSAALGYAAYRAVRASLPKLHARSPLAAQILAQLLIWAFAVWFVAAYFRLI
jgi:hypothetical protein